MLRLAGMFNLSLGSKTFACRSGTLCRLASSTTTAPVKKAPQPIDPTEAYTPWGGIRKEKKNKDPFFYTTRTSGTGYSHFSTEVSSRRPYIWPPLRRLFKWNFVFAFILLSVCIFDFERMYNEGRALLGPTFRPEAQQLSEEKDEDKSEGEQEKKKPRKQNIGFRERRIIQYEDRLRMYSSPDKIFRYFATLKMVNEGEGKNDLVLMTPEDFMRSFTPGVMQPRKYGLDKFRLYDPSRNQHVFSDENSIFYQLGGKGLLTYADYLFLMTLLSTSPKDFEVAFQIFDINGDGALDIAEYRRVQELVMSQTTVGQKHRDHSISKYTFSDTANSSLETYFFGADRKEKLPPAKFLEFQSRLHSDVLKMELKRRALDEGRDEGDERISYVGFAEMLLQYAELPEKRMMTMLKRMKTRTKKMEGEEGVTFQEVQQFFNVLFHIDSLESALHFHRMAGISITATELNRIIRKISRIELPENLILVAVALFDDNGDGRLSNDEFVGVVRRRLQRGLERPRDTGLLKLVEACAECAIRLLAP